MIPAKIVEAIGHIFQLDPLREIKINKWDGDIGKHRKGELGEAVFQNIIRPVPSRINSLYVER